MLCSFEEHFPKSWEEDLLRWPVKRHVSWHVFFSALGSNLCRSNEVWNWKRGFSNAREFGLSSDKSESCVKLFCFNWIIGLSTKLKLLEYTQICFMHSFWGSKSVLINIKICRYILIVNEHETIGKIVHPPKLKCVC